MSLRNPHGAGTSRFTRLRLVQLLESPPNRTRVPSTCSTRRLLMDGWMDSILQTRSNDCQLNLKYNHLIHSHFRVMYNIYRKKKIREEEEEKKKRSSLQDILIFFYYFISSRQICLAWQQLANSLARVTSQMKSFSATGLSLKITFLLA